MEETEDVRPPAIEPTDDAHPAPTTSEADRFELTEGPGPVISVSGELDAQSGAQLRTALARTFDAAPEVVVVDLSEVTFIDSVGISVLVTAHNRGEAQTIPFELRGASSACRRVFEITGLVDVLRLT